MTVVITGAGSGIGRCIAQTLAEKGFSLFLLGRNLDNLEATKKMLKNPEQHQCQSCDIRSSGEIRQALANVSSLYALIANAGIGGENQYGVNLKSPDFAAAARAWGAEAWSVDKTEQFAPALDAALAHGGPALIHVKTDLRDLAASGLKLES